MINGALLTVLLVNAALPGVAVGGYGVRALSFLVHLPLEWLAIAQSVAVYLDDHRRPRPLLVVSVVLLGALAESFLTPQ